MKLIKTGIGFDTHKFIANRPLMLGGVRIPHSHGLDGHSDADALIHAVMDALLGAIAAGDIGYHFPNTSLKWKGADSLKLLAIVGSVLKKNKAVINNIDTMVLAQVPKIAPYLQEMRKKIAGVLKIDVSQVSIKATTTEKMGAIGRKEGIAVMAVATVVHSVKNSK